MRKSLVVPIVVAVVAWGAVGAYLGRNLPSEFAARRLVRVSLIDPESARFRSIQARPDVICGQVNAKNRMGGYTGFTRFIAYRNGADTLFEPQDTDPGYLLAAFNETWTVLCAS